MSGLLIPNEDLPSLYKARPGDSLSSVARARTLAVLSRLDGDRKASVVRFLAEADLIERDNPVLSLARANLRGASLSGAYLYGTRLTLANLGEANLSGAVLATAHLDRADLAGADLTDANLADANLAGAYLGEAKLMRADLRDADLRGADLRGARGQPLTWKAQARSLKGATMPNGLKYEKWLKTPEGQN
jgi:uncharacterized protein YjbI with pentapeptide repeats